MTNMSNANFPMDGEGRTYHLYIKEGEVAARIITVGDVPRAFLIAKTPGFEIKFVREAPRLFITITGLYKGVPVSIVTSLMGIPNMDFTVRELRAVLKGPISIIRVGTCGSPNCEIGDVTVPEKFSTVLRIPDNFGPGTDNLPLEQRFIISKTFEPDQQLMALLRENMRKHCSEPRTGYHISTCSFYSTQGRVDPKFNDKNEKWVDYLEKKLPGLCSIEMETSHLLDLASNCNEKIYGCGAHIVLAQRRSQAFLDNDTKHAVEAKAGHAALETVISFQFGAIDDPNGVYYNKDEVPQGDWEQLKNRFQ